VVKGSKLERVQDARMIDRIESQTEGAGPSRFSGLNMDCIVDRDIVLALLVDC
jgi:hypothetical protein